GGFSWVICKPSWMRQRPDRFKDFWSEKNSPAGAHRKIVGCRGARTPSGGGRINWAHLRRSRPGIGDRMEGRVPQAITGDADSDPITVRTIVTGVKREGDK